MCVCLGGAVMASHLDGETVFLWIARSFLEPPEMGCVQ